MTWFRLDDQFHDQPKVVAAGNAAIGLYCRLGTWCADKLTDGFIPEAIARSKGTKAELRALTTCPIPDTRPLLSVVEGGYLMRDYLAYNPTRAKVLAEREAAKKRMQRRRSSPDVRANMDGTSRSPDPDPHLVTGSTETDRQTGMSVDAIEATATAFAAIRWERSLAAGKVDPDKQRGWMHTTITGVLRERSAEIVALLTEGLSPNDAAARMDSPRTLTVIRGGASDARAGDAVPCESCDGCGKVDTGSGWANCPECSGRRRTVPAAGRVNGAGQ